MLLKEPDGEKSPGKMITKRADGGRGHAVCFLGKRGGFGFKQELKIERRKKGNTPGSFVCHPYTRNCGIMAVFFFV